MKLGVVILAAGQGTRMRSDLPKVLHPLAGKPMLAHVIETACELVEPTRTCVVYGHGGAQVIRALDHYGVQWVEQAQRHGTGHAVIQALPALKGQDRLLVLYGDVPLTSLETLQSLIRKAETSALTLLTVILENTAGYGRIVRNSDGQIMHIVEEKDASESELAIDEVNTGIMIADRAKLTDWLSRIDNDNVQGEYYLTDVVDLAVQDGVSVLSHQPGSVEEVIGINDRVQLAGIERYYQLQQGERLMRSGVTLADPARFDLRGSLQCERDVTLDVNVIVEGEVSLGRGVCIGPNNVLKDCAIGAGTQVLANCVIENARIGDSARIGPFARIRPETVLADQVHVGNFVEIKKSEVGCGSKLNHLSYVGDSLVGTGVNVGAGTITCNYDGANKHRTIIGDGAFIGSNTQLVAPVEVGSGATIGAGSTITQNTPPGKLTLSRAKQSTIEHWRRPTKQRK